MTTILLLISALATQQPAPLHSPLDRATTASRLFVDCLVDQARVAGTGRAAPRVALAIARRNCRDEEWALDDVYRVWQRARRRPMSGAGRAEIRRLVAEAEARVVAERGGRR